MKKIWKTFVFLLLVNSFAGCSFLKTNPTTTIIPKVIEDKQASWDGEHQNSGILKFVNGKGFLITKGALSRYNALIEKYGGKAVPRIEKNFGVFFEGEDIFLSSEGIVEFSILNQKNKRGDEK